MITPAGTLSKALRTARARRPFLDHLVRTYQRYQADTGDRLAAAVTFYWFLSLFPILLLAISVTGYLLGDSARADIVSGFSGFLPQGVAQTVGDVVTNSKGKAGILGLAGTLLSGLGWIAGLREAIRTIWHQNVQAGNFVVAKVRDTVVLVGLFAVIAASVAVSVVATASTDAVVSFLGIGDLPGVTVITNLLAYGVVGALDVAVFLFLFTGLARVPSPLQQVLRGAVFGTVVFELVKYAGAKYVAGTTSKGEATYGTFAVVVGLLLFLNLVTRGILLAAAFTVTAPYDSDVRPSGTADPEQAVKAGIPTEYAGDDLNLVEDGAPTELRAAVQGKVPPQDEPTGAPAAAQVDAEPVRSWARPSAAAAPTAAPPAAAPVPVPGQAKVELAAKAAAGVLGVAVAAVGVHAVRTASRFSRR